MQFTINTDGIMKSCKVQPVRYDIDSAIQETPENKKFFKEKESGCGC